VIVVGTLALALPAADPAGKPVPLLDALFTATSAVCVTGLIVRDTAVDFTPYGQTVILVLIQLGGLGIMSVAGTVSLLLGRGIGLRESSLLRELFEGQVLRESRQIIRFVAGFSLNSDSLVSQAGDPLVVGTVAGLLIVGGLGFPVVANLRGWTLGRARRERVRRRLSVQARIVLLVTAILLIGGTMLLAALEWRGALAGEGVIGKLGLAFFQSATARTAGFNTMDLASLSSASLLAIVVLMCVGAAPGSTAGGIKLTTVAVLWANLRAIAAGGRAPRLFNREIGALTVRRAFMILTTWITTLTVALFVLLVTEGRGLTETLFETASAMGTVGLSLGLTPELSGPGRVVVVLLMFLGRLGPLAVAYGLVRPAREHAVRYAEADLLVG